MELLNIIEIFKMLYVNTVISDDVYLNAVRISSGINGFANVRNVAILLGVDFEVSRVKLSYLMYVGLVDFASCDCGCGSPIFLPEDFATTKGTVIGEVVDHPTTAHLTRISYFWEG